MPVTMRCDTSKGDAALDAFARDVRAIAAVRAVNALSDQAETAGFRKVAELYQIPARTMQQFSSRKYARAGDVEAVQTVQGRAFPLSAFKPVQTRVGVSVTIKGKRVTIPHAFMVARFGLHVFARGSYGGKGGVIPTGETSGRFVFGRRRLPISELYTFGPADADSNPQVVAAKNERVDEQAAKILNREIAAVRRGF